MKETTITLEKDDVVLVFTGNDVNIYFPKEYTTSEEPATPQLMVALAIAKCITGGHAEFTKVICEVMDNIAREVKEADGN